MSRFSATSLFVGLAVMWGLSFPVYSVGLEYLQGLVPIVTALWTLALVGERLSAVGAGVS